VVSGAVNPAGASVNVFFEFGTTTAYGQVTAAQKTAPNNSATPFAALLSGLPPGTTTHYRAVAVSDFGTFVGGDQALTTASTPPPPKAKDGKATAGNLKVSGTTVSRAPLVPRRSRGNVQAGAEADGHRDLQGQEADLRHRAKEKEGDKKVVVVGAATVTLRAGESRTVRISLNRTGKRLLAKRHKLKVRLRITQTLASGRSTTIRSQTLTFKTAKKRVKLHH